MGLAASQVNLMFLVSHKASLERDMTKISMQQMRLTREMDELALEYNRQMSQKTPGYYANGEFNKLTYTYLMGCRNFTKMIKRSLPLKENDTTVLTDASGRTVMSNDYANAILSVVPGILDSSGQGKPFSKDKIPEIMHALFPQFTADEYQNGVESYIWSATTINAVSGNVTGSTTVDTTDDFNAKLKQLVDFYYPIFLSAAVNGWTTAYNDMLAKDPEALGNALMNNTLLLAEVNECGYYDDGANTLEYFNVNGTIEMRTDSETQQKITRDYNIKKAEIQQKQDFLNIEMSDDSTDLEATKAQIESTKQLISDAMSVFNSGGGVSA